MPFEIHLINFEEGPVERRLTIQDVRTVKKLSVSELQMTSVEYRFRQSGRCQI